MANESFDGICAKLKADRAMVKAFKEIYPDGITQANITDCATCHAGENMGGQTYELMGIKEDYFADRGLELTNEDNGRYKETQDERDRHRFKVPGLRNVALTAPYFHDGTQKTLDEAVAAMAKYEVGETLTPQEVQLIVAYLNTLTGEYQGKILTNDNYSQQ